MKDSCYKWQLLRGAVVTGRLLRRVVVMQGGFYTGRCCAGRLLSKLVIKYIEVYISTTGEGGGGYSIKIINVKLFP